MSKKEIANQISSEISKAKLIIFDFDGTIVHLDVDWQEIKKELGEYCKRKYKIKTTMNPINQTIEKISEKIDKNFKRKADAIIKKYEIASIKRFKINEETVTLIKTIKKRKKLAIFSNNCLITIHTVLNKIGLKEVFDLIVSRDMVTKMKPNPEGLKKILDNFPTIKKSEVVFIGDKTDDQVVGKNTGLKTIIF